MSEEKKNLDEMPEEKAPVETKAEAPKLPLDKKTIAIIAGAVAAVLIIVLALVLILGGNNNSDPHTHSFVDGKCACGESDPNYVPPHVHSYVDGKCECGATDPNYVPPVTEQEYTLGMGTQVNLDSSKKGTAQIDATVATVVLDKDGKIVACKIDVAQNKIGVADGFLSIPAGFKTKVELKGDYGMASNPYSSDNNNDGIIKEWYEQAAAFEAYVIGKTVAEVEAMATKTLDNGYVISADDELLNAGCTIQITEFKAAVVKACNDEFKVSFKSEGNFTLGVAINSYNDGSKDAEDADGVVQVYSDIAAAVVEGGKVVAALNDAIQPKINFDFEGVITNKAFGGTKRELKEGYGMASNPYSSDNNDDGIIKEWYEQSAAFSKYVVGLTAAEIAELATEFKNEHYIAADDELLNAGCTIQITGIKAVVAKAAGYVAETEQEYTLGMGTQVNLDSSKKGTAQIDATVATVVLDKDGKIVACKIDVAQNKIGVADGFLSIPAGFKTKVELKGDYGMASNPYSSDNNNDGIIKEWYEQAAAFEAYVIGKTVAEVEAMATKTLDNGYVISADDELLNAGCTIQITEFKAAVVKACNDEFKVSFKSEGNFTLGVAINSYNDGSKDAEDADGVVQVYSDIAAAVVEGGKVVAALNDAIQPKINFDFEGVITNKAFGGTKRELKEGYGMASNPYSSDNNDDGIIKEWYEQSAAFSKYVVGLTAAEIAELATEFKNEHYIAADDELLNAGCTIQITGIKAVVAKAAGYVAE